MFSFLPDLYKAIIPWLLRNYREWRVECTSFPLPMTTPPPFFFFYQPFTICNDAGRAEALKLRIIWNEKQDITASGAISCNQVLFTHTHKWWVMTMAQMISGNNLLKADKPIVVPRIWNSFYFYGCVDIHHFLSNYSVQICLTRKHFCSF